jgi:hypothetical protein
MGTRDSIPDQAAQKCQMRKVLSSLMPRSVIGIIQIAISLDLTDMNTLRWDDDWPKHSTRLALLSNSFNIRPTILFIICIYFAAGWHVVTGFQIH